jgi:transcription elongation GreA/GreB family factor
MQEASLEDVKEFLLLVTKCHSLGDHDLKILHSLAEVAHPAIGKKEVNHDKVSQEIWTTEEGFSKLKKRIEQIATIETIENAKEIEVARSHGDLKENAEFKAALEKRARLQSELKTLSDQLGHARILTPLDVSTDTVSVGVIVDCKTSKGKKVSYTILGPWDADTEKNILSWQSKLAQTMLGSKVGQSFHFQNEEYTLEGIRSYFGR